MASSNSNSSTGAVSMADLMAKSSAVPIVSFKKGDIVSGTISKLSKKEILVDLSAKGQAVVLEKEPRLMRNLLASLAVGDKVEVSILNPESDLGQPVVSLRRFMDNITWKRIDELKKSQEKIDVTITEVTKGGYVIVTSDGMNGFLPNSHTNSSQGTLTVGKNVPVSVADINREDRKIIVSQKSSLTDAQFASIMASLKKGAKVKATVSNVTTFGFFVTLAPDASKPDELIDGLVHISELAWTKVDDISTMYKVGDSIDVVVAGFDKDARRIDLSVKRLTEDPFEKLKENYPVDKKVSGKVVRTEDGSVIVDLGDGVEGIIKKEKVPAGTSYEQGKAIDVTVVAHDSRRRRLELTPVLKEKPLMYR
jgi:ribosomal protein S1